MGFVPIDTSKFVRFNSSTSCEFLTEYENFVEAEESKRNSKPKGRTFAPSGFRCRRLQWFRLRGTEPDVIRIDRVVSFTAEVGTDRHRAIQSRLSRMPGIEWVDVETYLKENGFSDYSVKKNGFETLVSISSIPVEFACDGIIKYKGEYYLLEIKTADHDSFSQLTSQKPHHTEQVMCYCTFLGLSKVLFLYEDRKLGKLKCFEHTVSYSDKDSILNIISYVKDMVKKNIAPPRLTTNDVLCKNCPYAKKCKDWG